MTSSTRSRRLTALLFAAAVTLTAAAPALPDDPFQPPPGKEKAPGKAPAKPADPDDPFAPGAGAKPAPGKATWGGGASLSIPVGDHRTAVTFGPPGCPVMVVGAEVWDLKVGHPVRRLTGSYEARA